MKGTMIIIDPNGIVFAQPLDHTPKLDELQKAVGGYIEVIPCFTTYNNDQCIAFCNEEGKLDGLPRNKGAHQLWEKALGRPITEDHLVGSICIITGDAELMRNL